MSFPAMFPGRCGSCGERFAEGADVQFVDKVLVLVHDCDLAQELLREVGVKPKNVCASCWTIHAGECM